MVQILKLCSPAVLALMLGVLSQVLAAPVDLQAEKGEGFDVPSIHWRSNAEGKQAVWLREGAVLLINFCLPLDDQVTVDRVRFSRDGDIQETIVSIDGQEVGTFNTTGDTAFGMQWNEFNTTDVDFATVSLTAGQHIVRVALRNNTDPWGIEIDQVSLSFASNATLAEVTCGDSGEAPQVTTGKPQEKAGSPEGFTKETADATKEPFVDPCDEGDC